MYHYPWAPKNKSMTVKITLFMNPLIVYLCYQLTLDLSLCLSQLLFYLQKKLDETIYWPLLALILYTVMEDSYDKNKIWTSIPVSKPLECRTWRFHPSRRLTRPSTQWKHNLALGFGADQIFWLQLYCFLQPFMSLPKELMRCYSPRILSTFWIL